MSQYYTVCLTGAGDRAAALPFPCPFSTSGPLTCYIVPSTHRQVTLPYNLSLFWVVKKFHLKPSIHICVLVCFWTCPGQKHARMFSLGVKYTVLAASCLSICLHSSHDLVMTLLRRPPRLYIHEYLRSVTFIHKLSWLQIFLGKTCARRTRIPLTFKRLDINPGLIILSLPLTCALNR